MIVAITPVESERSQQSMSFLFLDDDATRPDLKAQREATADAWELIFSQDAEVLKDLQSGSHSQIADLSSGLSPTWEAATLSFRKNVARAIHGTKPTSSGNYGNSGKHQLKHINDNRFGNSFSWILIFFRFFECK